MMDNYGAMRDNLGMLLMELSVRTGEFTLKSGKKSNYYIDARLTTLDPEGARLTGALMLESIRRHVPDAVAVGGPTLGADPIIVATSLAGAGDRNPLRMFIVRGESKIHGMLRTIEGHLRPGDKVAIVEDVLTTGGSVLRAIGEVERAGGVVGGVFVIVDRLEGGRENLEVKGYPLYPIFTIDELLPSEED